MRRILSVEARAETYREDNTCRIKLVHEQKSILKSMTVKDKGKQATTEKYSAVN